MVVGFCHSLRLHTLASLIFRPSGVMSSLRKVVVLCRKLYFFSLQYNSCLCRHENTISYSLKCFSAIGLYINMSSKKIITPLSSISTNKCSLFACTSLVHLSDSWPLWSICIASSRSKMLSSVYFLLLYSTTNNHCGDPMM